jgi:hypothetical protein
MPTISPDFILGLIILTFLIIARTDAGFWTLVSGYWSLVSGLLLLAAGYWSLAAGYWSLVTGGWLQLTFDTQCSILDSRYCGTYF